MFWATDYRGKLLRSVKLPEQRQIPVQEGIALYYESSPVLGQNPLLW